MTEREWERIIRVGLALTALLAALVFSAVVCDFRKTTQEDDMAVQETSTGVGRDEYKVEEEIVSNEPVNAPTDKEPDVLESLGVYKLTAYCACEECCDGWALNRPVDEAGNPIVYTASGSIAKHGVTVAADTDILPFGTVLLIDGHEYTVQDRGGAINGKRIDIYFDSHEEALKFGVKYMEIFKKEEM